MKLTVAALAVVVAVMGCAAPVTQRVKVEDAATEREAKIQSEIALEARMNDLIRLDRIAYVIRTKAHPLCGEKTRYVTGARFDNQFGIAKPLREAAASLYGLGDQPKALYVTPGSPAERAGVKPGDLLVSLNDWPVPAGEEGRKKLAEKLAESLKNSAPVSLGLQRGTERLSTPLTPEKACDYNVALNDSSELNAFADGKNVVITSGMMRFAQDDTELALVVSHELAHNAMKHMDARMQNYMLGSILDILIGARTGANTQGAFGNLAAGAYSQEFEAEADYVGLYLMAHAQLDIERAPKFWRRMAAANPSAIRTSYSSTHPATAYRLLALEETVKEINTKRAAGAPLEPEKKKDGSGVVPGAAAATQITATAKPVGDVLAARLIAKEDKKLLLVSTVALRFGFENKADKAISRFRGKARLLDAAGMELGSLPIRHDAPLKPGQTADISETVYPLLFSGSIEKLREAATDNVKVVFEAESIEFADGTRTGAQ